MHVFVVEYHIWYIKFYGSYVVWYSKNTWEGKKSSVLFKLSKNMHFGANADIYMVKKVTIIVFFSDL